MDQPSSADIQEFLAIFSKLESFEACQRVVRGYGAFKENELPIPACRTVMSWLRAISLTPN